MRVVAATEFRARCRTLLDEVVETREELVITKWGKPVAKLIPTAEPRSLVGSVRQLVSDEELIEPLYENWEPDWPA
jgi:prevent-host-death family protein